MAREGPFGHDVTELLREWGEGDQEALDRLMPLVYNELHRLAERRLIRERRRDTLRPTALVNEVYLKLIDQRRVSYQNRSHFFNMAAQVMRRITLQYARRMRAEKRGGKTVVIALESDDVPAPDRAAEVLALDEALERLERLDPRQGRVVELRFFGGLDIGETAEALGISTATVKREWRVARAWLRSELTRSRSESP